MKKPFLSFLLMAFFVVPLAWGSGGSQIGGGNTLGLSCTNGQVPEWSGAGFTACLNPVGAGTVTSVGVQTDSSTSSIFANTTNDITGSPVTAAGNMTLSLSTQAAHKTLIGPTSGGDAAPTFRLLVFSDIPSTSANTASTVVARDSSGNFSAGTITAALTGNASTATALAANPADCASNTFATTIAANGDLTCTAVGNAATTATSANTNSAIVARDGSGNFSATTITANLTGNASGSAATFTGNLTGAVTSTAMATTIIESYTGMIPAPADGTYTIDLYAAFAGTINTLKIITDSGTATAAVKINGTNVTGISAVSVSSSIATGTASAANTFAVGDKITLVLSSSSTPVNLAFTLKYTR